MIGEKHTLANVNGKYSQAVIQRDTPWKGLGQELSPNASIETWGEEAGLNWQLLDAPVTFQRDTDNGLDLNGTFDKHRVIYRSDNGQPLSVVSNRYKKVQPMEILDFFREFTEAGDMTLETAGCIDNGSKVWALARIGEDFNVNGVKTGKDLVRSYALLASSCDKSISTIAHITSIRDFCTNTLRMIAKGAKGAVIKVPHSRIFNPDEVKQQMGLVKETIQKNCETMRRMHQLTVTDEQAMQFFIELLKTPEEKKTGQVKLETKRRAIPKIWTSYKSAPGAESTVWGMVNAVTHSVDYNPHARTDNARLNAAWFGTGAQQKDKAYAMASDENFLDSLADHTKETQTALDRVLATVEI